MRQGVWKGVISNDSLDSLDSLVQLVVPLEHLQRDRYLDAGGGRKFAESVVSGALISCPRILPVQIHNNRQFLIFLLIFLSTCQAML